MPEIRPFTALRFAADAGEASNLLAPPYDVIDADMEADLRAKSPYNCVRLILPRGEAPERYTVAADLLREWMDRGMLEQDDSEAVFVYRQRFDSGGRAHERRAFFAAVRLASFAEGEILPHEETHSGPKRDRLALTMATDAQLSPAFLIAGEEDGVLGRLLLAAENTNPVLDATTDDAIEHTLWRVGGQGAVEICTAAARASLLIADGHHRYETALEVSRLQSANVKAKYILACVVGERDHGLLLATTHRTLTTEPGERAGWIADLERRFVVSALDASGAEDAASRVAADAEAHGVVNLALHIPGEAADLLLTPRPEALASAGIDRTSAGIASVVFDRLVLRPVCGVGPDEAARAGMLSYHRRADAAASAAGRPGGAAFLLPPASLADVRTVAARGERLPPKSTYFEPKVPTGLMFRLL